MENKSGLGLLGLLQFAFIILKVLNLINWSWLAVFIPAFIELGLLLLAIVIAVISKLS